MFTTDFYQTLILAIVTVGLGAIALWTWQRAYWEYQLKRQREDWMLRQCYARKDSQRQAMEGLLSEINKSLEELATSTELTASAMKRRADDWAQCSPEGREKWNQEVDRSVAEFNECEQRWLVDSRVISGKIRLYFGSSAEVFEQRWSEIIKQSLSTCTVLNKRDLQGIRTHIRTLRKNKNDLLQDLQGELDRFVLEELELPPTG